MAVVSPSITSPSTDPHLYREQIERVHFAQRIHIDLMDGVFAPNKNINPIQIWWPENVIADVHLMYQKPSEHLETLISLKPNMVLLHAESDGDIESYLRHIKRFGIKAGVVLLADTSVAEAHGCIEVADHVLLFSGTLGSFGGTVNLDVLHKVDQIRAIRPDIEIGWDGGVNDTNIKQIVSAGIDVCTVGGLIQRSDRPAEMYKQLIELAK
ncbi:MAG: hypothetical protein ABIQ64_01665 [Candidatus Saccharimonadales bacterium]